ncbi:uncharacterized protein ARMOST_03302 [Armillaria ostoyae]|uniref:PNPLA domain-containing protein n=1 Tax=Armillaria ostoyae TaxID=47428 RepID=A0A284QUC3_ARMOS|nr:uncharacterized protein ARMOST_03302 [Armillaria ostoyae]
MAEPVDTGLSILKGPPLNLLSLDGGGIRGVSELLVLDEIMRRVQTHENLPDAPKPCEYFDLIGGTGTGGLVAIMLGRLKMSTTEALRCYNTLSSAVFGATKHFYSNGKFKATTLETEMKKVIVQAGYMTDQKLLDSNAGRHAKGNVFVCSMTSVNLRSPQRFRTYQGLPNQGPDCTIWEAVRATTAVPTVFKAIKIAGPGGFGPDHVRDEAKDLFGSERRIGVLLNIGTGHIGPNGFQLRNGMERALPSELIDVLQNIATDCERVADELAMEYDSDDIYFRFNVLHGAGGISFDEWKKMDEILAHTTSYLRGPEVSRQIDRITTCLCCIQEEGKSDQFTIPAADRLSIMLHKQIFIGNGYRFHSAHYDGKAVAVKIFEGKNAAQNCRTTAEREVKAISKDVEMPPSLESNDSAFPESLPTTDTEISAEDSWDVSPPRREITWENLTDITVTLKDVSRQYQDILESLTFVPFHLEPEMRTAGVYRLVHRCQGYRREEVTLKPIIVDCKVITYVTPALHEKCSICGRDVEEGVFNCICGRPDDGVSPTVKCAKCLAWVHGRCNVDICRMCMSSNVAQPPQSQPQQPAKTPVWQGTLRWRGFDAKGKLVEMQVHVVAFAQNPAECHTNTWPSSFMLTLTAQSAVSTQDLQVWVKKTQPALCTFAAQPRIANPKSNELHYRSLITLLLNKKVYAITGWTRPGGAQDSNVLLFPINAQGLVGAFFLNGIPELPKSTNSNSNPNPVPPMTYIMASLAKLPPEQRNALLDQFAMAQQRARQAQVQQAAAINNNTAGPSGFTPQQPGNHGSLEQRQNLKRTRENDGRTKMRNQRMRVDNTQEAPPQ